MDCLEKLYLGKAVRLDESGQAIPPRFWVSERVGGRDEQLALIEQYLGHHLGHVLGTVTSDSLIDSMEPWEPDHDPVTDFRTTHVPLDPWPEVREPAETSAFELLRKRLAALLAAS
jgi:hypothetical protein